MAYLDHQEAYDDFKRNVLEGIRTHFPITGTRQRIELEDLEVRESPAAFDDIKAQHQAKVEGNTFAAPVYANLVMKDREGKVVQRKRMRVAEIPYITKRYSYIVDGQEYQVDNQWQLKPGVYTRRNAKGELVSNFNTPNKKSFDVKFEPDTKKFLMKRGKSENIPVYPLMKAMGIDDDTLEKRWGKDVLAANKNARAVAGALDKFYKTDHRSSPSSQSEAEEYFRKTMSESGLDPSAVEATLGKPKAFVDGDVLLRATDKILKVQAGAPEDDRDSLEYKRLRSVGDFAKDRLVSYDTARSVRGRVWRKINSAQDIRDVVKFGMMNDPIKATFKNSELAAIGKQINPLDMASSAQQTTLMGPGGIQSEDQLRRMINTKLVNPSHLGFLDPVKTPESHKTGIVLRMPTNVRKINGEAHVRLYNLKTGKDEYVSPAKFNKSSVVLPDQVEWKDGKPRPLGAKVQTSVPGNKLEEMSFKSADYTMRHPSQMFSLTTNLIPFMGNTSGNRATYAGTQMEQAISLKNREAPLVQVGTGAPMEELNSFEGLLGRQAGHAAPIAGTVTRVTKDEVVIKGKDGTTRKVQLYNNFPLNDPKGVFHSDATVKVGDTVKQDQSVADTNYTKGGKLALGTNLRVAYIPYKGYNFEDGVVISESASKKMTSEHLHKQSLKLDSETVTDPRKFRIQHQGVFDAKQFDKLDGNGVVKVGQSVQPGDPLILAMKPFKIRDRMDIGAVRKSLSSAHSDSSMRWNSEYPGKVVAVHKLKDGTMSVHVRTEEPMQVGDKLAGRHGNKGIVTMVVPDDKMPRTRDGKHVEVALNPSGVPGRMNVGQVLETAAAKIAEKTGKPYIVNNFSKDNALEKVKADLKKAGLTDQEELVDPETGLTLGKALVGPQHIIKLVQQIDKKTSVRSGMAAMPGETPEKYDLNLIPSGSGKTGAQTVGHNGLYTLLAHGAKANIREMHTWKSEGPDRDTSEARKWPSQHDQVWGALQEGEVLPVPKSTFAFKKFEDMLRGAGVNMEKKGNEFKLLPFTDDQILALSKGKITDPGQAIDAKVDKSTGEPKARRGGLFDPRVTGGHGGKSWGHIELPEPIPNPVFEKAIRSVTGLKQKDYDALATASKALDKHDKLVDLDTPGSITGGAAIKQLLDRVDVPTELERSLKALKGATVPEGVAHGKATQKVDELVKKVKYLRALDSVSVKPSDAYVLKNLPVLPPAMRPVTLLPNGDVRQGDLTALYRQVGQVANELGKPILTENLTDEGKRVMRRDLYDGVKALMGMDTHKGDKTARGIMHQISGTSPKRGFFQQALLKRKTDMSMRSTIIPEPSLSLDEIGLPKSKALKLYQPFVVKKLTDMGAAGNVLEARKMVENKDKAVWRALERVAEERPVLVKRDPALHKHSIQAFKPKLVHGSAIRIHPLTTSGYNADFDGDTMSAYVPISDEAVKEARNMFPSNNLYNEATGKVIYKPTLEMALGLFKVSRIGEDSGKSFKTHADAVRAVQQGKLSVNDVATIAGVKTTPGRVILASALPDGMQKDYLNADESKVINKKGLDTLFSSLAKDHKVNFGDAANRLKDLGNGATYGAIAIQHPDHKGVKAISVAENHGKERVYVPVPTHSLGLDDFSPDYATRSKFMATAQREVDKVQKSRMSEAEKEKQIITAWSKAMDGMTNAHMEKMKKSPTNLAVMSMADVKPSRSQYRQMVLAPGLLEDASGKTIVKPVTRSYSEGLDLAGYWTQSHGARGGTIKKVQEVESPGVFSKQLMQVSMASSIVAGEDCGTTRGVSMPIGSKDIFDRVLASDVKVRGATIPKGTLLSPDVVAKIRAADKNASPLVRSTLKCEHEKGVCRKCAGLSPDGAEYDVGTNLGVIAAQSLGERSIQLTLKAFHSGGVAGGGAGAINKFDRVNELTQLHKNIPNSAALAMRSGKIEKVEQDATGAKVWIGGKAHHVGKDIKGNPLFRPLLKSSTWQAPRVGMKVNAGDLLSDPSRTVVNPHDLYKATNSMERVQNFLTDELHKIYADEGVRRQHVETVVRSMGQLTKVRDAGDASGVLKGEYRNAAKVRAINKELARMGKKPIQHSPILKGLDTMPQDMQEDWMAKMMHRRLKSTLVDAASTGAVSDIHGLHPVPGMAYAAEFGLNKRHALKPGLGHLKDVPEYAY